ncbi:hypothetical protein KC368_g46 [Hortaea werneckii]|nr:hypothetical protein KC368_g46 [Hortaea werneckii]
MCNRPFINSRRTLATYTLTSSAVHGFGAPNLVRRNMAHPSRPMTIFGLPTSALRESSSDITLTSSSTSSIQPPGFRFLENELASGVSYLETPGYAHTRSISDTHRSTAPL